MANENIKWLSSNEEEWVLNTITGVLVQASAHHGQLLDGRDVAKEVLKALAEVRSHNGKNSP